MKAFLEMMQSSADMVVLWCLLAAAEGIKQNSTERDVKKLGCSETVSVPWVQEDFRTAQSRLAP